MNNKNFKVGDLVYLKAYPNELGIITRRIKNVLYIYDFHDYQIWTLNCDYDYAHSLKLW